MKIVLTGCDGQVGTFLKKKLEGSVELFAFNRKSLDITSKSSVYNAVYSVKPDYVINAAAYTAVDNAEDNEDLAYRVNRDGAQYLAEAVEKIKASIIHISTDYVFDGLSDQAYSETDHVNPQGAYGASKLAGEEAVKSACERHIILRTAWVFSDYGNNFLKTMLRLSSERDNFGIVNDQVGGPTYAGDIANSIKVIIEYNNRVTQSQWGLYHYSGSPYVSWFEFASYIFNEAVKKKLLKKAPTLKPILSEEYTTKSVRPKNSKLNCNKIRTHFGIKESDWKCSVSRVLDRLAEAKR